MATFIGADGSLSSFSTPGTYGSVIVREPVGPRMAFSTLDPGRMWAEQPSIRKVIDYVARQIASTPCKVYRRVSDTDRHRVSDHPLARILGEPSPRLSSYRYWHTTIVDWLLYDRWASMVTQSDNPLRQWEINRVQAPRFRFLSDQWGRPVKIRVLAYGLYPQSDLDLSAFMYDNGYAPLGANGTSPIETLAVVLRDNITAAEWREQLRTKGPRLSGVIERPLEAADWHAKGPDGISGYERFRESWDAYHSGGGKEGGTPILEGGLKYSSADSFSPRDVQETQSRQLNDVEVCSEFHIAPELVGAREGNYSNVDAFRQDLYRTSLGPYYVAVEQVLNLMLVPNFGEPDLYVEFDLDSKLRGSFTEQASALSTSTGRPWMTTNEARGRVNLAAIDGGDDLVTPLNVITGGLASPTDTAPDSSKAHTLMVTDETAREIMAVVAKAAQMRGAKAAAPATYEAMLEAFAKALEAHFGSQADTILQGLSNGGKLDELWAQDDWDALLANVISDASYDLAVLGATKVLDQHNPDRTGWSADVLKPWLAKAALSHAKVINKGLLNSLTQSGEEGHEAVFTAQAAESGNIAVSVATESKNFGAHDAAEASGLVQKVWITGSNPRDRHKKMDGDKVGMSEKFSNGARYPGDFHLKAAERVNCNCDLDFESGD